MLAERERLHREQVPLCRVEQLARPLDYPAGRRHFHEGRVLDGPRVSTLRFIL
jgi:hypothetical protein